MVSGEAGEWMKGFSSRNSNGWQVADIPENSGQVSKVTKYPKWKQFSLRFKNSNTTSGKTKIINKGNGNSIALTPKNHGLLKSNGQNHFLHIETPRVSKMEDVNIERIKQFN